MMLSVAIVYVEGGEVYESIFVVSPCLILFKVPVEFYDKDIDIIDRFHGLPDESAMLKGVLYMGQPMRGQDLMRWKYFMDSLRITERMDEIRGGNGNPYPYGCAVRRHGRRPDHDQEKVMHRMTLKEQAGVLARTRDEVLSSVTRLNRDDDEFYRSTNGGTDGWRCKRCARN